MSKVERQFLFPLIPLPNKEATLKVLNCCFLLPLASFPLIPLPNKEATQENLIEEDYADVVVSINSTS